MRWFASCRRLPPRSARLGRVARVEAAARQLPRAWLPLEIYPVSAGIKGGSPARW